MSFARSNKRRRILFSPGHRHHLRSGGQAQASLRSRILRAFVGRGLLEGFEVQQMLGCKHSGFSVDTSVCIAAQDRAGLERLLRYCARPPFASVGEQWRQRFGQRCEEGLRPSPPQTDHADKSRAVGPEQALRLIFNVLAKGDVFFTFYFTLVLAPMMFLSGVFSHWSNCPAPCSPSPKCCPWPTRWRWCAPCSWTNGPPSRCCTRRC